MAVSTVADVLDSDLSALGLLAIMPSWKGGGRWPDAVDQFEAMKYVNPDTLDGLFSALQHGIINVGKGVLESKWVPAAAINTTPAEDGSFKPARPAVLNNIACRVFDFNPSKAELFQFQDFVVLQDAEDLFQNYIEIEWTTESVTAGKNVGFDIDIQVVGSDGEISGTFETVIPKISSYDTNQNRYRMLFPISIVDSQPARQVGDFVICRITRNTSITDDLQDWVGIINVRLI